MTKKILIFGLPLVLLVLLLIYYQLGGFNKVRITIHEPQDIYIIGKEYSGRYQSKEAKDLYYKVKELINDRELKGYITIVNYPTKNNSKVKYFIGVLSQAQDTIDGWEQLEIRNYSKIIRLNFNKHNLVMPKPFKVREMAEDFAISKGYELKGLTIEKYKTERELEIDYLVN
jgi:hypothetical protein